MKTLISKLLFYSLLFIALLLLTGCKGEGESPSPTNGTSAQPQTSSPTLETINESSKDPEASTSSNTTNLEMIEVEWQNSPHANTFVVDEQNQNNSCARCHAPDNWAPSMGDLPESCFACKFELEDPSPLIDQSAWVNIPCNVCHRVDKKGQVQPEYAWLEIAALGEYTDVASTDELCLKCHQMGDVPNHVNVMVSGVHQGFACTQCHSAHSTTASCSSAGCHDLGEVAGHDEFHQSVSCIACHDGSGLEVDVDAGTGFWTTFLIQAEADEAKKIAFSSHNITLEVNCRRCHFTGNSWGLSDQPGEKP